MGENFVHDHHHCQFLVGEFSPDLTLLILYYTEPAGLRTLNSFIMDETQTKPDYTEAEMEELRELRVLRTKAEEETNKGELDTDF